MKTFATDENNDLFLTNNTITIGFDRDAVKHVAQNVAKTQLGELVLNTDQGLPNFQVVWVGVPNLAQFDVALRTTLLQVTNILSIESLTTQLSNNTLFYTAVLLTSYGEAQINGGL